MLLGILQQRIELDKECMFQFTQLRKEVGMTWMSWIWIRMTWMICMIMMKYLFR